MSLERAEFVGGDLVMVTELADRDLKDVWSCFQREGRPGIPRDQLLNYLREAAETLDLVNTQHNLQHLDLKPSNLFLVCNHIKIGDFGLVVSLFGKGASPKGLSRVVTPYMSPEVIEGGSHRQSDQYSLAVTYQEMITGVLPFHGTTPEVLRQEHLRGCPDLEALPVADRSVVARALAKDPQLRFPSCSEFIKALVLGHIEVSISPSVAVNPTTETDTSAVPELESEAAPAMSTTDTDRTDGISETPATMDLPVPPADDDGELPIYQFVRCLNRTPLTEVWDVHTSSGRRRVAKILFGPAGACSAALNRLLSLRHPVLAPLEFVQNTPGRLVLVSDPVKKNLRDCFQEYRAKGQPGIPRQQLLGYLKEAASALTDLSRKERLQHLGLNPRNLFLAGDKVRIADFGIAQLLWLPIGEPVSRMNPRYSAPELVQRRLSPSCDQYSLALIYHEMLTGYLPQTAGTSQPVVLSDLNALPESERAVIARAIDRDPKNRWETCLDLIQALESPRLSAPHADAEPLAARQVLVATPVEEEPVSRATDATEYRCGTALPAANRRGCYQGRPSSS